MVVSRLPNNRKDWEDWACGVLLQADMRARAAEYAGHATVEEAHRSPMPPPTAPVAPPPEPGHAPVVPRPKVSSTTRQVLAHVEVPPRALSATSTAIITASSRKRGRTLSAAATGQDPLVLNDELDKLEEVSALAHATRFAVHSRSSSAVRPAKKVKKVSNLLTAPEPQLLTNWVVSCIMGCGLLANRTILSTAVPTLRTLQLKGAYLCPPRQSRAKLPSLLQQPQGVPCAGHKCFICKMVR